MPTAATYWTAAADFDGLAARRANEARRLGAEPLTATVEGGLAVALERALQEIAAGLGTSATGYAALADECRRRAIACETYSEALASYHGALARYDDSDPRDRPAMPRPTPPHREPWITLG